MATFYVKSGAGAAEFAVATYSSGDRMVPALADASTNFAVARKWVWECTTGGLSVSTPTWPASVTQDVTTVTSGTATFTARKPGFSSGTTANWTYATIYALYAASAMAAGDTLYISNNHAETQAAAYLIVTAVGCLMLCVSDSAAPPTAMATSATITTTGNVAITVSSSTTPCYWYGVQFFSGSGANGVNISVHGTFESCSMQLPGTVGSVIQMGSNPSQTVFINCTYKFAAAASGFRTIGTVIGGSLLSGGTSPTALIDSASASNANAFTGISYARFAGLDLTNANAAINLSACATASSGCTFRNMRLPASWSGSVCSATPGINALWQMFNSDSAGTDYIIQRKTQYGTLTQETATVRTGGASDGTTPLAWKLVSLSTAGLFPFGFMQTPEIVVWNATVGSAITVTVEAVSSGSVNDDELWLEVNYLGTSGAPLGTLITSAKASVLATAAAVPTSTAAWSSPPSTPAYQKMSVTFTPQIAGFIHATVKLCKASKTVYIDPVLTVTGVKAGAQYQVPGGPYINEIAHGILINPGLSGGLR